MIYEVEQNEEEVQSKLEALLRKRTSELTRDAVNSWNTRDVIEKKLKDTLSEQLDGIIADVLSKEDLEAHVKKTLDSIIKSKVKKAVK
jgi:hypothetical protein